MVVRDVLASSDPDLVLRFATAKDVDLVLALIRELATYERLAGQVVADSATLEASLFGDRPAAEVVLAEYAGRSAGFALFFHNFSTFLGKPGIYLEDLFVREHLRGKGIGRQLLRCLARIAVDRGCGRVEWAVLDWNAPAIRFYTRLGAEAMDDWTVYRLGGSVLSDLAGEG